MKKADAYLFVSLTLFVITLFVMQLFSLHLLYDKDIKLLSYQINEVMEKAYSEDLNNRIRKQRESYLSNISKKIDKNTDLKKDITTKVDEEFITKKIKDNYPAFSSVAIGSYVSRKTPFKLEEFDKVVEQLLTKNNIEISYTLLLQDTLSNRLLYETNPYFRKNNRSLTSQKIPLGLDDTRVVQMRANPSYFYFQNILLMTFIALDCLILILYCLRTQYKSLVRQKTLLRLKNGFFADVSHELKQPLSVLRQIISSLQNRRILDDPSRMGRIVKISELEIRRLTEKIDMVLILAKHDEGAFELNYQKFDLVQVVNQLIDEYVVMPSKKMTINVVDHLDGTLLYADRTHIDQVISNLISNAVKYSGSVVNVVITLFKDNHNIYISVKDDGFGISTNAKDKIFDKYARIASTDLIKGHGIGLNYTKRIIEKHKGEIFLTSEIGKGSEFLVKLPRLI